ncbi:PREDICTED: acetylcholine receptor subunit beta-like 1 [Priapulus caudatus]|uniref:Acetylcholine receptor subunit beta-like 1 n=1 Tax=Priapulus caudatus TaxID=37621 RepID=A0ABM1DRZ9_PRICU|nr:PREDICTED: acetylcholine receptor subunit beta-like 1 [Priapulus caudatus]
MTSIYYVIIVLHFMLELVHGSGKADKTGHEDKLVMKLFNDYNRLIRPVRNQSEITYCDFGVALTQIINVDEKNQIIKTNIWLRHTWNDYQLAWDPTEYNGLKEIQIPSDKIWVPDIVLFNNADGNYQANSRVNIVLNYDGTVQWIPPAIFQTSCTIDVRYFPYDQQTCGMKFGSWTFSGDLLQLAYHSGLKMIDLNDYVYSGTWDLIDCPSEIIIENGTNGDPPKEYMYYSLQIRRKTLFYTINLVMPCVSLAMLSMIVFYLPSDCGEKMTLAISLLLALIVFLFLVSMILPPTSLTIPLVSKYLLFTFLMNICTIFITVIIINWNYRGPVTHNMPRWIKRVFIEIMPKFLFMKRPNVTTVNYSGHMYAKLDTNPDPTFSQQVVTSLPLPMKEHHHPHCSLFPAEGQAADADDIGENSRSSVVAPPEVQRAACAIELISDHLRVYDKVSEVAEDWRYVAMVLDRLLLYTFVLVILSGTLSFFVNAPGLFEFVDQEAIINNLRN